MAKWSTSLLLVVCRGNPPVDLLSLWCCWNDDSLNAPASMAVVVIAILAIPSLFTSGEQPSP